MTSIADQAARQRFIDEVDRNFSIIASAGSGKTRAITDRIVEIAKAREQASTWLPQLIVVTYTNRAADEMQQRTRQRILEARLPLETVEAFGRAFFGTIHAFCVKLLASHGHRLGLPSSLELITDDDDLWNEFVQQQSEIGRSLGEENRRLLFRLMQTRQLMELARRQENDFVASETPGCCPDCDFSKVEAAIETTHNVTKAKLQLRDWLQRWRESDRFAPWPPCATTSKDFVARWREAFQPLRKWASACASCVAAEVQRDYRQFRLARGAIKYSDQVALAAALLRIPDVAQRIRAKNYRVILDEAQDTDPQQFFVLTEITRPVDAGGDWFHDPSRSAGPQNGHFSMVGDFQQSIYRDPNDLNHYRRLHRALVRNGAAEELKFSVTFRLDQAQLNFVNDTFARILNEEAGQVEFVRLNPRPDVLPGQVVRFDLGNDIDLELPETQRARIEAKRLAKWISDAGLEKLRARCWREVAILCPRKAWLRALRDALVAQQIPVEVQSESDRQAEHPAYAWLTALLAIVIDPDSGYQIIGVLREVFGISDDELARFAQGDGDKFQIVQKTAGRGLVPDTLNLLYRLREALPHQPLFSAVYEIVRVTQLRQRLANMPTEEFGDSLTELERLLTAAGAAEARRESIADFLLTLRRNFGKIRETEPTEDDALQLITSHKAKGSEWDAVVVPFLAREARLGGNIRYPLVIAGAERFIAFDRSDRADLEDEMKRTQRQEMERLLYVALTRARRTLVLALDPDFFRGKRGVHGDTQLKWLQADVNEGNAQSVTGLPDEPAACKETAARQREADDEPVVDTLADSGSLTNLLETARNQAATILRTITPSQFTPDEKPHRIPTSEEWVEIEPELRPPRIDNPATRYGIWWHTFVAEVNWSEKRAKQSASDDLFEQHRQLSPDPARSSREWKLLLGYLSASDNFFTNLTDPVARTEMPFFWRMDDHRSLEGIVDLALVNPTERKLLILDWKTDRVPPDSPDTLRSRYLPQLAAYWKAIGQITKFQINAAIYSTAAGKLIHYDSGELENEWSRLEKLPPDDFGGQVPEPGDKPIAPTAPVKREQLELF